MELPTRTDCPLLLPSPNFCTHKLLSAVEATVPIFEIKEVDVPEEEAVVPGALVFFLLGVKTYTVRPLIVNAPLSQPSTPLKPYKTHTPHRHTHYHAIPQRPLKCMLQQRTPHTAQSSWAFRLVEASQFPQRLSPSQHA